MLTEFVREITRQKRISNEENNEENTVDDIVSNLRWYPRGNPPAVVILRRGANRKVLATISPKSGKWSHLYKSWEPVLAQLAKEKEQEGVSRISHDGMEAGEIPKGKKT